VCVKSVWINSELRLLNWNSYFVLWYLYFCAYLCRDETKIWFSYQCKKLTVDFDCTLLVLLLTCTFHRDGKIDLKARGSSFIHSTKLSAVEISFPRKALSLLLHGKRLCRKDPSINKNTDKWSQVRLSRHHLHYVNIMTLPNTACTITCVS